MASINSIRRALLRPGHFLSLQSDRLLHVSPVCGGQEDCQPDYVIDRESFPYWSLEFVSRGKGSLRLAGRETALSKGAVFTYDQQTPYQLLTCLKMNKAAELLEESDKLIKQVAAALGYVDPFHFSRTFKSVFGMSPNAFRRLRS